MCIRDRAWVRAEQEVLLAHDRAFASSLLEEDVPPVAIVRALKQAQETEQGAALLREAGWTEQTGACLLYTSALPSMFMLFRHVPSGAFPSMEISASVRPALPPL